ncbi:MAG: triphosphoribosyl-dephospho-CoA synthase [Thermovirgaceae bacterium]
MKHETILAATAAAACLAEVHAAPKPGLVDRAGPGAHRDMDYSTFLASSMALAPYWAPQATVGLAGMKPNEALVFLRKQGLLMDRAMLTATGGVNTHKGLIFALSLLLYGAGFLLCSRRRLTPEETAKSAAAAVKGCCRKELEALKDAPPQRKLTSGEKIFLAHGLRGIRGEAESGFPSALAAGLPSLRKALASEASLNDSALYALFHIMDVCEDTNIVARKGYPFWIGEYRRMLAPLLELKPPFSKQDMAVVLDVDTRFSDEGISPGGAADLLTCTLFLHWIDGYPNQFVNTNPAEYNICNFSEEVET